MRRTVMDHRPFGVERLIIRFVEAQVQPVLSAPVLCRLRASCARHRDTS